MDQIGVVYTRTKNTIIAHERLAIVDPSSGQQPLFSQDDRYILSANGEIYNHLQLRDEFPDYDFSTKSDCEVILPLYEKYGPDFLDKLNGIFAFAIYDSVNNEYFVARDHMGIIPLYIGWDDKGVFYVSSELKALEGQCEKIGISTRLIFNYLENKLKMVQKRLGRLWQC